MISESPIWCTAFKKDAILLGYGWGVFLASERVIGPWFCLDRVTGEVIWHFPRRKLGRPNKIVGVENGVIVATETRHDGPCIVDYGAYGISVEDGSYLWPRLQSAGKGWFARLLDFVPDFTNEFRATAVGITSDGVLCERGELLDLRTGKQIGQMTASDFVKPIVKDSYSYALFPLGRTADPVDVKLGVLSHESGEFVQMIPIAGTAVEYPDIEGVDQSGVLVSYRRDQKLNLVYFSRSIEA